MNCTKTIQNGGFNLFFSLTLGNHIRANQRKSLKNIRKLLEMSLSLSEYTVNPLRGKDEFITIRVTRNMCKDP